MSTYGVELTDGHTYIDIGSPLNEIINSSFGKNLTGHVRRIDAIKGNTIYSIHIYANQSGWFSTTYMVRAEDMNKAKQIANLNRPFDLKLYDPSTQIETTVTLDPHLGTKAKNIKRSSRRMKRMKRSEKHYSEERSMKLKKRSMKRK
jgi:hypothetical protein